MIRNINAYRAQYCIYIYVCLWLCKLILWASIGPGVVLVLSLEVKMKYIYIHVHVLHTERRRLDHSHHT